MGNADYINGLIIHPKRMNGTTLYQLRTIVARYPYFQKARLLLLCNLYLLHDPDFNTELHRSVFYVADRRDLWCFVNGLNSESLQTAEQVTTDEGEVKGLSTDHTMSLIDDFLQTISVESDSLASGDSTATDYLTTVGLSSETEQSSQEIDVADVSATLEIPEKKEVSEGSEEELEPEFLTETLARIYIKQKKYDRALAIIRSLYLNFPEKSIYFADQIRFLEKLVRNNQSKKVK
ncbi:MAG: tetratricopeptide repeat protein [Bacteroidaceae bacterium]|nr:tetratricopeptide repeat protein [Bacteroidaceae bacterium]